jgi:hypothetical protein
MGGRWLVTTRGSTHVWDLDTMTCTRRPGPTSGSGAFAYDDVSVRISRVERWPRVGATFLFWFDDPGAPQVHEHWRQSSTIQSITALDRWHDPGS